MLFKRRVQKKDPSGKPFGPYDQELPFWWIRLRWNGRIIQESTRTENRKAALQMEATRRLSLAKGEYGLTEPKKAPRLGEFIDQFFVPHVEVHAATANTKRFYKYHAERLSNNSVLRNCKMDEITVRMIEKHAEVQRASGLTVATVNRDLMVLKRMFNLAVEWEHIGKKPRIKLLAGENRRERVITVEEEKAYLAACPALLKDVATLLFDLGLRPEECFRLKPENFQGDIVTIFKGKGRGSRRKIPCSARVLEVLSRRNQGDWLFPAPTRSGHIDGSSIRKQHVAALKASEVLAFVPYAIRHTCISRWSRLVDAFTLHVLAGHISMSTTERYVHHDEEAARKILKIA